MVAMSVGGGGRVCSFRVIERGVESDRDTARLRISPTVYLYDRSLELVNRVA